MRVGDAREVAAAWVRTAAADRLDVVGAFFSGSTVGADPELELPATSDVDVVVVLQRDRVPAKPGKIELEGILIEVTYLPYAELADPEAVAGAYVLAASFATDTIIHDPTGALESLHQHIAADFADPRRVRRRVDAVRTKIINGLAQFNTRAPWHQQVLQWLFPSSLATHAVLVAGLRNPTVRLRYPMARQVLQQHGVLDDYPRLVDLIGCTQVTPQLVQQHLDALAVCFDQAAALGRTPFPFSTDITPQARPIAIDGSQALIAAGDHREAVFWIIATFGRCQQVLAADAPAQVTTAAEPAFRAAVSDLCGMREPADLLRGAERDRDAWPAIQAVAEEIIARRTIARPHGVGASGGGARRPNSD